MTDRAPAWHEDDSFWEIFAPAMFTDDRVAAAPIEVDGVLALAGIEAGARVLDMPCGIGRHTLELARRGFAVTGVDRTQRYLDAAGGRARDEGLAPELVRADMREFVREGAFDLALNLFTSLGYFDDPNDDLRVLENARRSLRPGGALVLEMGGKEPLARQFQPRDWRELPDGSLMLEERAVRPGWDAIDNRWILIRDGVRSERRLSVRIYTAVELGMLLRDAGFAAVAVYGGLDGSPYDLDARRLVAVARA